MGFQGSRGLGLIESLPGGVVHDLKNEHKCKRELFCILLDFGKKDA
jgi:hypothetical protein